MYVLPSPRNSPRSIDACLIGKASSILLIKKGHIDAVIHPITLGLLHVEVVGGASIDKPRVYANIIY